MEAEIGYPSKIAPELSELAVGIGSVKRHPENAQQHNIPAIAESLQYHGQRTPIVVQKSTGLIVKGNGTHEAAELLGWTEIAAIVQEMDDQDAVKYLIADNRASELAKRDQKRMKKLLDGLTDPQGTLFTEDDILDMEDPVILPIAEVKGDYADAGEEAQAREAKSRTAGAKMKEIPVVLTAADHAIFIENLQQLMKRWSITGYRATIVEAVKRAVGDGSGESVDRRDVVREIRDYFLTDGRPSWTAGAIAAFFQSQLAAMPEPKAEANGAVADGQTSILEQLA